MKAELQYKRKRVVMEVPEAIAKGTIEREELAKISLANLDQVSLDIPPHTSAAEGLGLWQELNGPDLNGQEDELDEILDGYYYQKT